MSVWWLADHVLDNGLHALSQKADTVLLTENEPASLAEATSSALCAISFGAGNVFPNPPFDDGAARCLVSVMSPSGTISVSGDAAWVSVTGSGYVAVRWPSLRR
jgi:hypothetical protein